jgi:hypothetical protein
VATNLRFVGGMRGPRLSWLERGANASWPLAELTLSNGNGCVRLRLPILRSLLQRWLPTFDFDPASVAAEPHEGWFSPGVRFVRPDGASVVFWTSTPVEVVAAVPDNASAGS